MVAGAATTTITPELHEPGDAAHLSPQDGVGLVQSVAERVVAGVLTRRVPGLRRALLAGQVEVLEVIGFARVGTSERAHAPDRRDVLLHRDEGRERGGGR